jgi:hypothetical protein
MKWSLTVSSLQWRADEWVHFHDAAEAVATELKLSVGVAERRLREQCASGDVRSIRYEAIEDDGEIMQLIDNPLPIKSREWAQDQLDITPDTADDQAVTEYVDVSKGDVEHWIEGAQNPKMASVTAEASTTAPKRASRKREFATLGINELWCDGVPASLPNTEIEKQFGLWLTEHCKQHKLPKPEISRDTILRAAGRKQ